MATALLLIGLAPTAFAQGGPPGGGPPGQGAQTIMEIAPLSFGLIHRPTMGMNVFTIHYRNGQVTTGGSGDGFHLGDASNARYLIEGDPHQAVTITAEIVSFAAEGVVVEEIHVNGTTNSHSSATDGQGRFMARIGGVVHIFPNATPGLHETTILLTVDHE